MADLAEYMQRGGEEVVEEVEEEVVEEEDAPAQLPDDYEPPVIDFGAVSDEAESRG